MTIISLGALSEKFELFWPKKLGRILVPPVTQLFVPPVTQLLKSKWLNFSLYTERKKLSHFDPKSWVTWVELRQKHL